VVQSGMTFNWVGMQLVSGVGMLLVSTRIRGEIGGGGCGGRRVLRWVAALFFYWQISSKIEINF
jgi:hypothetical protein